jgi:hypothetical protein
MHRKLTSMSQNVAQLLSHPAASLFAAQVVVVVVVSGPRASAACSRSRITCSGLTVTRNGNVMTSSPLPDSVVETTAVTQHHIFKYP